MDRRTKILAGVVGVFVAYGLMSSVVYPKWLEPIFTIDDRVEKAQARLDELLDAERDIDRAKWAYRRFLNRVGSFDTARVENDLRERLNKLVAECKLDEVTVSGGSGRLSTFGKTNAKRMTLTVDAATTLEGAMRFLQSVFELPHLVRVGNVAIYPSHSSRRKKKKKTERIQIRVPLEVLVLPQHTTMEHKLADEELQQPESLVRHEGRNYALIWERPLFTEYVELAPLVVNAGKDMVVEMGKRRVSLSGSAAGGDGDYTVKWSSEESLDLLSAVDKFRPRVNTSKPFSQILTLSVTDGSENSGTDQIEVTVREKIEQVVGEPVQDTGPKRWKDGHQQQFVMALLSSDGDVPENEMMIYHSRSRKNSYYRPGDEFDGGKLLFVHPRGAVVRRQNEYFVYPIGAKISDDLPVDEADDYPTLKRVAELIREALGGPDTDTEDDSKAEGDKTSDEPSVVAAAKSDANAKNTESTKTGVADSAIDASQDVQGSEGGVVESNQSDVNKRQAGKKSGGKKPDSPAKALPVAVPPPTKKGTTPAPSKSVSSGKSGEEKADGRRATDNRSKKKPTGRRASRSAKRGSGRIPKGKRSEGAKRTRRPPSRSAGAGKNSGKK